MSCSFSLSVGLMSLPQTNLQLYQCLSRQRASVADLGQVRAAYDVATRLFGDCVRPSHKPFVCHLVGTAGALALWQQELPVVIAGLLHSVYLFGRFDDGDRGPTARRRAWLRSNVGDDVENLVWCYSTMSWDQPIKDVRSLARADVGFRKLVTVKFADQFEELSDGGSRYSLEKPGLFGLRNGKDGSQVLVNAVAEVVHDDAARQFCTAWQMTREMDVPDILKTDDRSFQVVRAGVDQLRRNKVRQRLLKWSRKIRRVA